MTTQYKAVIEKEDVDAFYALIVRVDNKGDEHVLRGYKPRYFKTKSAAIKSTGEYIHSLVLEKQQDPKEHEFYDLCYRAHYNTSFSPEKRAASWVETYETQIEDFKKLCKDDVESFERIKEGYKKRFVALMLAKSRCISVMITGGSNFPTRRAEKANASEHKRQEEYYAFIDKITKIINKKNNPVEYAISSDDNSAIDKLNAKIEKLVKFQEQMKDGNKILRNKKMLPEDKAFALHNMGFSDKAIAECLKPDYAGRYGFPPYMLSNNNAEIKRLKTRVAELEAKQKMETKEQIIKGVRVVENVEDNRIQLFFDGKPAADVIKSLKSHGMKWSGRNGCWQRMLNGNGKYSVYKLFLTNYEG